MGISQHGTCTCECVVGGGEREWGGKKMCVQWLAHCLKVEKDSAC